MKDELDVVPALGDDIERPVVFLWLVGDKTLMDGSERAVLLHYVYHRKAAPPVGTPENYAIWDFASIERGQAFYKTVDEVWLEMRREEYKAELGRSPLQRGDVCLKVLELTTCLALQRDKTLRIVNSTTLLGGPKVLPLRPRSPDPWSVEPIRDAVRPGGLDRYRQAMLAWNALDNQLALQLSQYREWPTEPSRLDAPALVNIYLKISGKP